MKIKYVLGIILVVLLTWNSRMDIRLASYFTYGCFYIVADAIDTYKSKTASNIVYNRRKYRQMKEREYGYGYLL